MRVAIKANRTVLNEKQGVGRGATVKHDVTSLESERGEEVWQLRSVGLAHGEHRLVLHHACACMCVSIYTSACVCVHPRLGPLLERRLCHGPESQQGRRIRYPQWTRAAWCRPRAARPRARDEAAHPHTTPDPRQEIRGRARHVPHQSKCTCSPDCTSPPGVL